MPSLEQAESLLKARTNKTSRKKSDHFVTLDSQIYLPSDILLINNAFQEVFNNECTFCIAGISLLDSLLRISAPPEARFLLLVNPTLDSYYFDEVAPEVFSKYGYNFKIIKDGFGFSFGLQLQDTLKKQIPYLFSLDVTNWREETYIAQNMSVFSSLYLKQDKLRINKNLFDCIQGKTELDCNPISVMNNNYFYKYKDHIKFSKKVIEFIESGKNSQTKTKKFSLDFPMFNSIFTSTSSTGYHTQPVSEGTWEPVMEVDPES